MKTRNSWKIVTGTVRLHTEMSQNINSDHLFLIVSLVWVKLCPSPISPNSYIKILTPRLKNVSLFGNRVTADAISEDKVILDEIRWAPKPIWVIFLIKRENLETGTHRENAMNS